MNALVKLVAIFVIWTAFTIIMTVGNSPITRLEGESVVWLTIVLAIAAGGSTLAISLAGTDSESSEQQTEKAKRTRTRVGKFMASLSDHEIAELRARLMADGGEMMPLGSLLHEEEGSRRERR